ncbi:hypothetical protein [Bradyrhizobium canariense]|uniref:hypothetical protein n=1 Tax=Bradyrhizobium canariense TaxID=255045 RepID=UPI000A1961B9|nr:hypothetical protein [Bradyrhizobium canariense]OSI20088.1 hypothetical protein BST65_35260 [Bradyrhizobium canariense]OSI26161.1 hypothetical protein BST66_38025 [Bradyrhizobium canariense]OSI37675.1 hypothetical protein BSZ20_38060 [Bradyrhizobium canariense]OSI42422.1 hypothetical protein BST67_37405 [Bradyrhizobium canariense]OSI57273.1 hypothetical protein BSZ15_14400 [Bradyrhizobium canariense]
MTAKKANATATPAVKPVAAATATVKLLVGEKAIKDALMSIHRRGQTLQQDMHVAACSVLSHVEKHSDIRLISALLAAAPEMTRKNALKEWFVKFGPVTIEGDEVEFVKGKGCDLKTAMLTPFWTLLPEPEYKAIEVEKFLDKAIKQLARDEKELGKPGLHTALMHKLASLKPANSIAA